MKIFNMRFKKNSEYEDNYNGYYGEDYQYGENEGTEGYEPDYNNNGTSFEDRKSTRLNSSHVT